MKELLVRLFSIKFSCNIGKLNDIKIKKINEKINNDFETVIQPNNEVAIFTSNKHGCAMVLTPIQITFNFQGENVTPVFSLIQSSIMDVLDVLMIEPIGKSGIQIIGNIKSEESMGNSFNFLKVSKEDISVGMKGVIGVGLRFLIDHSPNIWEYKVEPMIKDQNFYFIEALCGNDQEFDLETVLNIGEEAYQLFINDWRIIAQEYLLERG